jgi:hypothetical protein
VRPRSRAARDHPRPGQRRRRRRARAGPAARLRPTGDRGRQRAERFRRAGGQGALPVSREPRRGRAHPSPDPRPLSPRARRDQRIERRTAPALRRRGRWSSATPRARWSATACAASIPTRTSRSA